MMFNAKLITLINLLLFLTAAYSQNEKQVKIKTNHGKLYGSLVYPADKKEVPVVLIIAGSGPTDRNGNSMMVQSNAYKMLAKSLAKEGIASLRYDKQGIGESADARLETTELTFQHLVQDAISWVKFLKKKGDFSSVTILGHSQGSLIGILAAQEESVDAFISLAGAGNTIDKILKDQLSAGAAEFQDDTERILSSLKKGDTIQNVPMQLMSIFSPEVQPFLISWIKLDPAVEIAKLEIPILVIQGTTDIQVKNREADILAKSGDVEVQFIEGMNHVLKVAPAQREENIKTYYDPKLALHKGLSPVLVNFIKNL